MVTIVYSPKIPAIAPGDRDCPHAAPHQLSLNTRIEKVGRQRQATCDAMFCMRCGAVHAVTAQFDDWFDALGDAYREHGWYRDIGMRLQEFVDGATANGFEAYMALQGINPERARAMAAQ